MSFRQYNVNLESDGGECCREDEDKQKKLEELQAEHRFTEEDLDFFVTAHGQLGVERLPEFAKFLETKEAKPKKQSTGAPNHPDSIRPFRMGLTVHEIQSRLTGRYSDKEVEAALQYWIAIQVVVKIGHRYTMTAQSSSCGKKSTH